MQKNSLVWDKYLRMFKGQVREVEIILLKTESSLKQVYKLQDNKTSVLIECHFLAEASQMAAGNNEDPCLLPILCLVSVTDNVHCDSDYTTRRDVTYCIYLCHNLISIHQKWWKATMSEGCGPGDSEHMVNYNIVLGLPW